MLEPAGFARGYDELALSAVNISIGGTVIALGSLRDLIRSKEILGREKDREHLPELLARETELEQERSRSHSPGDDLGPGLSL